jgi:phosphoglycolate phosphatase-like HAD superfamily hydrolase
MLNNNNSICSNKIYNLYNLSLFFSSLFFTLTIIHFVDFSLFNTYDSILVFAQTSDDISNSSFNNINSFQGNNFNSNVLPSWNEEIVKDKIITFMKNITDPNNPNNYIPPNNRIAVFDNDGTLWSEKPIPFQGYFMLDRLKELSIINPEIIQNSKFKELLKGNLTVIGELNEKDVMELSLITHSNISQTEFNSLVSEWIKTAKHPVTNKKFVDMIYQPLLELLDYLSANEFKIFIVSGGGIDFMRQALSSVYGIPPEQIIGSSIKYEYVDKINSNESPDLDYNGTSFILRKAELNSFNNDYEKPANIQLHIGKVPVIAVGNSDGDLQMLEYADDNNPTGKSLKILIHHDDPIREFSYDKGAEKVLEESKKRNWNIISMKDDFATIFPYGGNETSDVSK